MSFPSGDHEAPVMPRLKKRSSIGTGRALAFRAEVIVAGSVIVRSSGERAKTNASEARAMSVSVVRMAGHHIVHLHGRRGSLTGRNASRKQVTMKRMPVQ